MKISKVNHRRTAVAEEEKVKKIQGVLYKTPVHIASDGEENSDQSEQMTENLAVEDLQMQVQAAVDKSKDLYSPFNEKKIKWYRDFPPKWDKKINKTTINEIKQKTIDSFLEIYNKFNSFIRENLADNPDTIQKEEYKQYTSKVVRDALPKIKDEKFITKLASDKDKKYIELLVEKSLNSAFKRPVSKKDIAEFKLQSNGLNDNTNEEILIQDIMKKTILRYFCGIEEQKVNGNETWLLLTKIHDDYNKENRKNRIIQSFDNQKVKIQEYESTESTEGTKDNQYRIQLGITNNSQNNSQKDSPKKILWDFLVEYAEGTKQEQMDKLFEIQKLIVLYIYGQEMYKDNKIDDFKSKDIWKNPAWSGIKDKQQFLEIESCEKQEKKQRNGTISVQYIISSKDIRNANMDHFRKALRCREDAKNWFGYFSHVLETLFNKDNKRKPERLDCQYLCKYIYNTFCSYIACKYIDLGKGVYHFTMGDLDKASANNNGKQISLSFGNLDKKFIEEGITSFDYEKIKAKESFERSLLTYVHFSTIVFSKSVICDEYRQKNTDVLQYRDDKVFDEENAVKKDALKNILQFYGGESRWKDKLSGDSLAEKELFGEIRSRLDNIRNGSVHYTAELQGDTISNMHVRTFFEKDYEDLADVIIRKYYSNNAWRFYDISDIKKLITKLYTKEAKREEQIPAFKNIIKKSNLQAFIVDNNFLNEENSKAIYENVDTAQMYRALLYFILKEIYYYGFLQDDALGTKFADYVEAHYKHENLNESTENQEHAKAEQNFYERVTELKEGGINSIGAICQAIMTDYNMQNQDQKTIRTNKQQDTDKKRGQGESYKHFPLILYATMQKLFVSYLQEEEINYYEFLKTPIVKDDISLEKFKEEIFDTNEKEEKIQVGLFLDLNQMLHNTDSDNSYLLDWYVLAHFLTPNHLNHLIGDVKSYIQYIEDIENRAKGLGVVSISSHFESAEAVRNKYEKVVRMLEFTQQYVGRVSNVITDYFKDEEDYINYLSDFVDLDDLKNLKLDENIYKDAKNPILNRNIVNAKIYGQESILKKCFENYKIKCEDINTYHNLLCNEDLQEAMKTGICTERKVQIDLKNYQNAKNRIELLDVSTFTDILNDFMAQMISWTYLRERDMMYFQLGIHYIRLYFANKLADDNYGKNGKYRTFEGKKPQISITDGAILYQIVAMNTFGLKLYKYNEKNELVGTKVTAGNAVNMFAFGYCQEKVDETDQSVPTYNCGMQVFETLSQHDDLAHFRNRVVHMYYMAMADEKQQSILQMMWTFYSGFFKYDTKLKKSTTYIFKNILMRYQVDATLQLFHDNCKEKGINNFSVVSLNSDVFTYKLRDGETVKARARTPIFLKQLAILLDYPNDSDIKTPPISENDKKDNGGKKSGQKFTKSKKRK